jgi:lysophospholipase L1-like esterase
VKLARTLQLNRRPLALAVSVLSLVAGMLFVAHAGGAAAGGPHSRVAPTRRLTAVIASRADVGGSIVIRLHDRRNTGRVRLTICITPPGGRRACSRWYLRAGRPRRVIRIPVARPGGWRVSVLSHDAARRDRTVWVSHAGGRLRLLAAGDSEMQILDTFIAQDAARYGVRVTSDARISTGLTNSFFFDWPRHARAQTATLQPDATVFFIGANDGFSVRGKGGHQVGCCGADWAAGYANLVAQMMRIYLRGRAGRVYWFVLPTPRPANFQRLFNAVNAGIRSAARRFPGRVALIDANAFFTPGNRYRDYMVYRGHGFVIHEPDGIHLSTAADHIDASFIVGRLLGDRLIR